jgi:hypothetical protein
LKPDTSGHAKLMMGAIRLAVDGAPKASYIDAHGAWTNQDALNVATKSVDKIVLATVNAPYRCAIDAGTLTGCLARAEADDWLVHLATFFTDVSLELVFAFAAEHGLSKSKLAEAYFACKKKTGEQTRIWRRSLSPWQLLLRRTVDGLARLRAAGRFTPTGYSVAGRLS